MSDDTTHGENRDVAAVVFAGVLVAISLALGFAAWIVKSRMEPIFIELGIALPGITIFALHELVHVIALALLVVCAAMVAIRGLRMVGLCSWVVALFFYVGFWSLAFGYPYMQIMAQTGKKVVG